MKLPHLENSIPRVLIVSITPYFLEKGWLWFEENFTKILQATKSQPFFQEHTLFLEQGQSFSLTELLRKLDEMGYEKVFEVRDPGEFSHQGGTVEVFPLNRKNALRVEFVGNKIEEIEELSITAEEESSRAVLKKRLRSQKAFSDIAGLKENEYVVHLDHGVARFAGLTNDQFPNPKYQILDTIYYILEYAAGDKVGGDCNYQYSIHLS